MKTQMRFQKILMLVSLVVAALTFVFALFFLTGSLGEAAHYITIQGAVTTDKINATEFVDASQGYVKTLVTLAIVFIVLAAVLFITACHSRRKYYITNYIAIGAFVAFALAMVIYIFIMVSRSMDLFLNGIAWEAGTNGGFNVAEQGIADYPMNRADTYPFIIGYVVAVIVLVNAALLVLSTVWKTLLMKGEKKLLAIGAPDESATEEVA